MAQVQQETIVITISKLVKGGDFENSYTPRLTSDEFASSMADIVGALLEDTSLHGEVSALDD